jgi:hypothetical protein
MLKKRFVNKATIQTWKSIENGKILMQCHPSNEVLKPVASDGEYWVHSDQIEKMKKRKIE